jgi:hypothetical protein
MRPRRRVVRSAVGVGELRPRPRDIRRAPGAGATDLIEIDGRRGLGPAGPALTRATNTCTASRKATERSRRACKPFRRTTGRLVWDQPLERQSRRDLPSYPA